ncbi:HTH domain-containing protein [Marinococcus sp. PL1-022]|uniref:HTH domain-containing protein n=1 Tax=Marinococcus sp. PL1-022 TaxID=3095363 RepID=UPI0029C47D6A|nr:HTH domain-containing protein [Marinococcus sp. PL1-022]MDX6153747.1 HTH domain-containing protein [Marinococcus sp. PL1-022]MDX6153972.1 HTH domain-containing protein [Marinococcus sp. PL1-022]
MKRRYSASEQKQLEAHPCIRKVSDRTISYHPDFKKKAVHAYHQGAGPAQIFVEHDLDLTVIGKEQPKRCLQRWRQTHERYGDLGLEQERRGKGAAGRPSSRSRSTDDKLQRAETRIQYLEAEIDFLKKLEELERQVSKKKHR